MITIQSSPGSVFARVAIARRALSLLAAIAILAGCASLAPPGFKRDPLERPDVPQSIAVVAAPLALETRFEPMFADRAEGFGSGAVAGAGAGLGLGLLLLSLAGPALVFAAPAALAAAAAAPAAAGALLGGAAGAAAVPPEDFAAALRRLSDAMQVDPDIARSAARTVAKDAARFGGYRADVVEWSALALSDAAPDYRVLRDRGYGAAIELRMTKAGYTLPAGAGAGVAMFLVAEARYVDTSSGRVAWQRRLVYQSPLHAPDAWERGDKALARWELAKGSTTLGERVVDDFVLHVDAVARSPSCGIVPIHPVVPMWMRLVSGQARLAHAESTQPTLAWQDPLEGSETLPPGAFGHAADVRYDLRIWNDVDGAPGELVYERYGLAQTSHRLETPLAPLATYYWSVRMRCTVNGRPRAIRWNATEAPLPSLVPALSAELQYARIEGDRVVPVTCKWRDVSPCLCLDFIPAANHYVFRTP